MAGDDDDSAPPRIEVGYVARAHGVRGEVLAVPLVGGSTTLGDVEAVWIGGRRHGVERARPVPDGYLLVLAGVGDRDVAAALRGQSIEVERGDLDLDEDDVLLADLVGCKVVTADGVAWGEVAAIELGPQDRLVIHDVDARIERLLPVVDAFLADIDLEAGVITITPPDGIPEDPLPEPGA
ncbi:MAG TPA: ribosome maturation factor RimM [Kofleriaceae bacterium]|nr:ribosome maturation factor RimM [Kofleriaceae bacterium]